MQEINRFKLGLFVCFAVALFAGFITMLGMLDRFRTKAYLMTLVSESVQGLTPGAGVKYLGVPIGTVKDITIETESQLIRIDLEVNPAKFHASRDPHGDPGAQISKDMFFALLDKEIAQGLRCKIEPEGITGMKYIEFDFVKDPPAKTILRPGYADSEVYYVPSVPSLMSDLRTSFIAILEKLESLDLKGMTQHIESTFASADKLLNDSKFQSILTNFDTASKGIVNTVNTLNATVTREQLQKLLADTKRAMASFEELSRFAEKEVADARIGETTGEIRKTLESFRRSSSNFTDTMARFNDSLDAILELIQYVDTDPGSLLRGKQAKPTDYPAKNIH